MGDTMSDTDFQLDLKEQLARIDRALAETRKFQEESNKFAAETRKLTWDRFVSPVVAVSAILGAVLGGLSLLLRVTGRAP